MNSIDSVFSMVAWLGKVKDFHLLADWSRELWELRMQSMALVHGIIIVASDLRSLNLMHI